MLNFLSIATLALNTVLGTVSSIDSEEQAHLVPKDVNDVCNQIQSSISSASDVYFPRESPAFF